MRRRTASLALLVAPLSAPASADIIWPDHGRFALKPRISLSVRPAPPTLSQRQARIYAIELSPSPAGPADLRLAVQRHRQRFLPVRIARLALSRPYADIQPRTSVTLAQAQADLPVDMLDDRLAATVGWQAVKIANRSVNATSPYTRDNLRVRDPFLPSAGATLASTDRLTLRADYGQSIRAYGDSGTIGSLGLTVADFRAFRNGLRAERASRTRLGTRWAATPALHVGLDVFAGRISDRLVFGAGDFLPRNMDGATLRGVGVEAAHRLSPTLDLTLRYDRAQLEMVGTDRTEQRLALQGAWRRGPWRSALTVARTSMPAWARPGQRLRLEGGVDYAPTDLPGVRLGLHLTDPDRLAMAHLPSGPVRAMDQSRALMLAAALRW